MAKSKSGVSAATIADEAMEILMKIQDHVEVGMRGKSFAAGAWDAIAADLQPKIEARLKDGGIWEKEQLRPLMVSIHLGQICALLTTGKVVSKNVAFAAYTAVRTADEACVSTAKAAGGQGGGDWCA